MIGVLITTSPTHMHCIRKAVEPFKKTDFPILIGWDGKGIDREVFGIETFATGKRLGKQFGELHQIHIGAELLAGKGCDYVFKTCGDIYVGKPELIEELPSMLGYNTFICSKWHLKENIFGTQVFFGRIGPLIGIARYAERLARESEEHIEFLYTKAIKKFGYFYDVQDDIDDNGEEKLWKWYLKCKAL